MQISIVNGSVEYDGSPVLSEINFNVHEKEKIALVGRNGCGKTTLLKALSGEVDMIEGTGTSSFGFYKSENPVIGFLKQAKNDNPQKTMEDEILEAYYILTETENKIETLRKKIETDPSESNIKSYSLLMEKYDVLGGYTYRKEYLTAVKKFDFSDNDLKKPLDNFSGGQRTKIALLKLLLSKPDVLLLDEPTNHLDLEAIEWLEHYLSDYKKSFVIVSHDRMFLDKTVNIVYEIEYGEMTRYKGNYSSFVRQKQTAYDKAFKDAKAKEKEIARLTALVEKFRYKKNKAAFAQAKLTQLERMGKAEYPTGFNTSTFKTSFQPEKETVEKAIEIKKLSFGYSTEKVLGYIDTIIKKGDKVGIIGPNGSGKSTLVKTIMHKIPAISGGSGFGLHANVGYFDQKSTQSYSTRTLFEDFQSDFPQLNDRETRTALGAFLFSGDDVFKSVGDLSGGEKVRLALCKIFKKKPNILILDEPTNHMDIIGKETLESMLCAYKGTLITVSHDRYFINRICNRLIIFEEGQVFLFEGSYSEYEQYKSESQKQENKTGSNTYTMPDGKNPHEKIVISMENSGNKPIAHNTDNLRDNKKGFEKVNGNTQDGKFITGKNNSEKISKNNLGQAQNNYIIPGQTNTKTDNKQRPESESRQNTKKLHRMKVLEEKMAILDWQISEAKKELARPEVYSDFEKVGQLQKQLSDLEEQKSPYEEEWLEIADCMD